MKNSKEGLWGAFKFNETFPIVFGQLFLFIFIQQFLFGINAYESSGFSMYDYYGYFLVALSLFILGYSIVSARKAARAASRRAVLVAGALSLPASVCLLLDLPDLLDPSMRFGTMAVCLAVLCGAFCLVQFAWLNRIKQEAPVIGARSVLLSVLVAAFVYSVITPSDANPTVYMHAIEAASLPLASLFYAIPRGISVAKQQRRAPASKGGIGYLVSASLLLLVMLLVSYVDVLNEGYPEFHYENPTFYVLLVIAIAASIAVFYRVDEEGSNLGDTTQGLLQVLGILFLLSYIFVFFYASSSYEFCFQFTCFLRRFVAVIFFVIILSLTFMYDFRIELSMGIAFFVPYFLAKSFMMISYPLVTAGVLSNVSDFRLIVVLVLGVLLVIFVGSCWYFNDRTRVNSLFLEKGDQGSAQSVIDGMRRSSVERLSEEYSLSEREKDVLYYLSMGYSVNKIAESLYIAANTAGTHIYSIYKKMEVHSKQDVIDAVNEAMRLDREER